MGHKGFLHRILFIDIETVPLVSDYDRLKAKEQELFERKTRYQRKEAVTVPEFYAKAGIWAEFGKIICISTAYLKSNLKEPKMVLKSFYGDNEKQLLSSFKEFLKVQFNTKTHLLCAHNGKEFDFPYLARRMIINQIALPEILNVMGKKPWEIRHLDTMELWKFGDYKHYTSLELLTYVLGINSPKENISGKDIARIYYKESGMDQIVNYCEKDTIAVAKVYFRMLGFDLDI